jgi:hypothetical protein
MSYTNVFIINNNMKYSPNSVYARHLDNNSNNNNINNQQRQRPTNEKAKHPSKEPLPEPKNHRKKGNYEFYDISLSARDGNYYINTFFVAVLALATTFHSKATRNDLKTQNYTYNTQFLPAHRKKDFIIHNFIFRIQSTQSAQ